MLELKFLMLPTMWVSAARLQWTYRLSTASSLGEDGALKWVLPHLMSILSSSGHPSGRDSSHMSTTWVIQCCRPGLKHCTSHCLKANILVSLCMWPWVCSVMAIQLIRDGPDAIIVAGNSVRQPLMKVVPRQAGDMGLLSPLSSHSFPSSLTEVGGWVWPGRKVKLAMCCWASATCHMWGRWGWPMPPCGPCHSALHGWAVRPCSQSQCSPDKLLDGVAGPWSGRWWERPSLCYPGPAFGAPYSCSMVVMELLRHNDDVVEPDHIAFPGPLDHVLPPTPATPSVQNASSQSSPAASPSAVPTGRRSHW